MLSNKRIFFAGDLMYVKIVCDVIGSHARTQTHIHAKTLKQT